MLGRPVVTAKQMAMLKTRFRKAEERVEQRAADGGAAGEMDIGSFLAERVLSLRAAFDTRAFLRAKIARVDAVLYAVARSPALELVGGVCVFASTFFMLLEHEYQSPVGDYWARPRNFLIFEQILLVAGLVFSGFFFAETILKLVALRVGYFVVWLDDHDRDTDPRARPAGAVAGDAVSYKVDWFNVLDLAVTATLAAEFRGEVRSARLPCAVAVLVLHRTHSVSWCYI